MFRKLVSNLAFSPALVGQLSFYAKRLKKEELTRRLGLIFTALALVVQSFAVFQPPEAVNASSAADFVNGGVSSVPDFLNSYDSSPKLKALFSSLGITRGEIAGAKAQTIGQDGYYNWSMTSLYSASQGQRSYTYYQPNGTAHTVFNRPLALTTQSGPNHAAFVGHSKEFGWFAIKKDCGNLVTPKQPPSEPKPESSCQNLTVEEVRTNVYRFVAKSDASGGANIRGYTFIVESLPEEKIIHRERVATSEQQAAYRYERTKPGKYRVSVTVHTSLGDRNNQDCRARFTVLPVQLEEMSAVCSGLKIRKIGRNNIEMTGAATVKNATVSKYTFVIKNSAGKVVSTQPVTTNKLVAKTNAVAINTNGNYTAQLTVTTSLGNKTDKDCIASFTITPPPVCPIKPSLPVSSPDCQPCPDNPDIWIKDEACSEEIIQQKTAVNLDQANVLAMNSLAKPSDRISYTITVENTGYAPATTPIVEKLDDVLEYATVADAGGGTFDPEAKTLTWPAVEIKPQQKQTRTFMVRLASTIPATNTGTSDQSSYDCVMTNTFGNSIDVNVECPVEKLVVEQITSELPQTGVRENLMFAGILLAVVTYFYARARQTGKEIRLIRRDMNAGTI